VHGTSKVPDCEGSGPYHIDFIDASLSTFPPMLVIKNLRKINGQFMKTALPAINARPGLNVLKNPHPAVYPNGIEAMVSEGEATGSACVRGAIARPNLTAQEKSDHDDRLD
jgi:hypothetical protein